MFILGGFDVVVLGVVVDPFCVALESLLTLIMLQELLKLTVELRRAALPVCGGFVEVVDLVEATLVVVVTRGGREVCTLSACLGKKSCSRPVFSVCG